MPMRNNYTSLKRTHSNVQNTSDGKSDVKDNVEHGKSGSNAQQEKGFNKEKDLIVEKEEVKINRYGWTSGKTIVI